MSQFRPRVYFLFIAAFAIAGLISPGCTPALASDQAESELAAFMLDRVTRQKIGVPADLLPSNPQPWAAAPQDADIIIWAPPADRIEENSIAYLKTDEPIKVWWYAGDQLVEVTDKPEAIAQFRQAHMSNPSSTHWSYYEFGILSLSNGNRDAEIYLGVSCGPLCGEGVIYVVHRNDSGQWETKDIRNVWIS
jgi:hypothetical protein